MEGLLFIPLGYFLLHIILIEAQQVNVIEFNNEYLPPTTNHEDSRNEEIQTTKSVTACFRAMPQTKRDYVPVYTKHLRILLRGSVNGFVFYKNFVNSTFSLEIPRLFRLCQPWVAGEWTSICVAMKLTNNSQLIKVFQTGKMCMERLFSDGIFDSIHYKSFLHMKEVYPPYLWSPHGMVTQLNIWARMLSDSEMKQFTSNCSSTSDKKGKLR